MILVIGGSGVVGSKVVESLLNSQQPVRILARGMSDWHGNPMPHFRKLGVDVISGDIRDSNKVMAAIDGCTGIVHVGGTMNDTADQSLQSVHVEALINLVGAAANQGVQRFIYVSCLGATQFSTCNYFKAKWQAESVVRSTNFYWTILRPSLIFGPGSQLSRSLEYWVNRLPVIPVVGSGLNRIQPVSGETVADCIVQAMYNKDTVNKTFDIVGPDEYTLTELIELYAQECLHKPKSLVKVPAKLGYALTNLLCKLNPRSPISEEIMKILTTDMPGDPALMQQSFNVPALSMSGSKRISVSS